MARNRDDRAWRDTWGEDLDRGVSDRSHAMLGLLCLVALVVLSLYSCAGGTLGGGL